MVVGFIVEGDTESILFSSPSFRNYLDEIGLPFVPDVENSKGHGNLLPKHIEAHKAILSDKGADTFIVLTGAHRYTPAYH